MQLLRTLDRHPAPALLEALVANECRPELERVLDEDGGRIGAALHSIARFSAPAELEERLHEQLSGLATPDGEDSGASCEDSGLGDHRELDPELDWSAEEDAPQLISALRSLERVPAPKVLERLVREDLEKDHAPALRLVGSLDRRGAPAKLQARVVHELGRPSIKISKLRMGALAAAVALLITFIAKAPFGESGVEGAGAYSFQVVEVSSASELSPMAAGWVDGLRGGLVSVSAQGQRIGSAR